MWWSRRRSVCLQLFKSLLLRQRSVVCAVAVRMPFTGGGTTGNEPPGTHHHYFSSGFAWDLHGGMNQPVYARLASSDGTVTIRTGTIGSNGGGAGQYVPVLVRVNGTTVGTVWYEHLANLQVTSNSDYSVNQLLGYTASGVFDDPVNCGPPYAGKAYGWPYSSGWQVCTPSGVHTHADVGKGCYRSIGLNTAVGADTAIIMLSTSYAADNNSACDNTELDAVNSGIVDTDGDGVPDTSDDCPATPGTVRGCPDLDRDGIADLFDLCVASHDASFTEGSSGVQPPGDPLFRPFSFRTTRGCGRRTRLGWAARPRPPTRWRALPHSVISMGTASVTC